MNMGKKDIVAGDIFLKSPNVIEWKVPNFFCLAEDKLSRLESPSFQYLDGMWCLRCDPNVDPGRNILICLTRKNALSHRTFALRLGIRGEYGIERTTAREVVFKYDGEDWYRPFFLRRKDLMEKADLWVPEGEATFICILPPVPNIGESSQISYSKGKDVVTETTVEDFRNSVQKGNSGEDSSIHIEGTEQLSQSFQSIFLTGDYHDTIIKVKDEEFRVHKLVLIVRSSVFASMFRHDTIERKTNVVTIEDCSPEAFKEFLSFLYSGKLENISVENSSDLYYIADKYQVTEVKSKCVNFMINNLSVDNFCDLLFLALRHSERKLLQSVTDYFVKNERRIIETVKWISFLQENPVEANELHIKALKHRDTEGNDWV